MPKAMRKKKVAGKKEVPQPEALEESNKRTVRPQRKTTLTDQEGGHSLKSVSEHPFRMKEGGHNQASSNKSYARVTEGGHSQASRSKSIHYGNYGRYNDNL